MQNIFFSNWQSLLRTFILIILIYILVVVFLRAFGKRSLSKMNAFDFIVTIALGSCLPTVALNKNVSLADGGLALLMLLLLQFIITKLSIRSKRFKRLITCAPALLLYRGELLMSALKEERITTDEIYKAIREKGFSGLKNIDAIILETTGDITVIEKIESANSDAMNDVKNKSHETFN